MGLPGAPAACVAHTVTSADRTAETGAQNGLRPDYARCSPRRPSPGRPALGRTPTPSWAEPSAGCHWGQQAPPMPRFDALVPSR